MHTALTWQSNQRFPRNHDSRLAAAAYQIIKLRCVLRSVTVWMITCSVLSANVQQISVNSSDVASVLTLDAYASESRPSRGEAQ